MKKTSPYDTVPCGSCSLHKPHDWDYKQVWGGLKVFTYHCPGIYTIKITTWEEVDD